MKKPEPLTDTQILKRLNKEMKKSNVFSGTNFKTMHKSIYREQKEDKKYLEDKAKKKKKLTKKEIQKKKEREKKGILADINLEESQSSEELN